MAKYFAFINKIPYDMIFKPHACHKGWYLFYVGKYHLGTVIRKMNRSQTKVLSWSVILHGNAADELIPRQVDGFVSRMDAAQYVLQTHELTRQSYNSCLRNKL